ncbi:MULTISPECIES: serine/threonine protein kinase [unclassified Chitinophaga]|uniref:serine/threonine protein kinase n=1 Tax=unclassified Chitinophaga TaxID=2619133 RepID=UPI0030104489
MSSRSFNKEFLDCYGIESFFKSPESGGQKAVYFVVRKGRSQVMKIIHGPKDERFDREMKIYEKYKELDGIPKVFETSEYHGETIIFEEFIEGTTLQNITSDYKENTLTVRELVAGLFRILTPVWKDQYVHRDLKPLNIIIRPDGSPVILDFGIARDLGDLSITGTGGLQPGSWKWAAPEQYFNRKDMISYRTDFFSIGVIAYFLFHQRLPFGNNVEEIHKRFQDGDDKLIIDADCGMKNFLTESMKFRPGHRPRRIEDLANLI